jgi:hypothetical protein
MFKFILGLLRGERRNDNGQSETVRHWTEQEPDRVRTFEETTQASAGGGVSVSISYTHELATSRQIEFLQKLGFSADGLTKGGASTLLDRILRPVDYALKQTFKNANVVLQKEHLRMFQVTIARWDYCSQLPRFGPYATWPDLEASGNDPHRSLTKEEKIAITEIALQLVPPEVFLSLKSNGIKKYKDVLDGKLRADT